MDATQFQRVAELFEAARQHGPGDRTAFLDDACRDEPLLRQHVEALLTHHDDDSGLLDRPAFSFELDPQSLLADDPALADLPPQIGHYRVLRLLGEGGMGVVYLTEQEQPRRLVAVKVLKAGVASRGMLRRFEHEVHILGRLQHPAIAQIFDAGLYDLAPGRRLPFYAMEYIDGRPLTRYAEAASLDTRRRLELMASICDAVQYAHQRGVIHRDLKPGNILVVDQGAEALATSGRLRDVAANAKHSALSAQPKILDFGVARLADADTQLTTIVTGVGQLVGTLPYMSPEQLSGEPMTIDTRCDVYSLGVVMYELLTGRLPYDLAGRAIPDAMAVIRDQAPQSLSSIDRSLRGDLDIIVAKALAKDRARRYQSAGELGADIRRHLAGEPIAARRDSALYVLRKTLRRYRLAAGAATAFVVLLATFSIVVYFKSEENRRLAIAERFAKDRAIVALDEADRERRRADDNARRVSGAMRAANLERGRLLLEAGQSLSAEGLMWPAFLADPQSRQAHWGLRELYVAFPCVRTIATHWSPAQDKWLNRIGISPDGALMACQSAPRTIGIWDTASGECIDCLSAPLDVVNDVAFSRDDATIFVAGADARVFHMAISSGDCLGAFYGHTTRRINDLDLSADGGLLVSAGEDGRVMLWSTRGDSAYTCVAELAGHTKAVTTVAFDPPGGRLASAGLDETIRIWNVAAGECERVLTGHTSLVWDVRFSPNGATLVSAGRDNVRVWDAVTGDEICVLASPYSGARSVSFNHDGSRLAVARSRSVELWDMVTQTCDLRLMPEAVIEYAAYTPDTDRLATFLTMEGTLRLWDLTADCDHTSFGGNEGVFTCKVSPDGSLVASGGRRNTVYLWDRLTGRQLASLKVQTTTPNWLTCMAFHPTQPLLASGSREGALRIWDVRTHQCIAGLEELEGIYGEMDWSPDGTRLAVACKDDTVKVWTLDALRRSGDKAPPQLVLGPVPPQVRCVRFSPDGRRIASSHDDYTLRVWDATTGEPQHTLLLTAKCTCLEFTPDGRRLLAATAEPAIEVWDLRTAARVTSLMGHHETVWYLSISPSTGTFASGSQDETVKLWDLETLQCLATLNAGHDVHEVCFTPDGAGLFKTGPTNTLLMWQLSSYDRHIAGNLEYQLSRLDPDAADAVDVQGLNDWLRDHAGPKK